MANPQAGVSSDEYAEMPDLVSASSDDEYHVHTAWASHLISFTSMPGPSHFAESFQLSTTLQQEMLHQVINAVDGPDSETASLSSNRGSNEEVSDEQQQQQQLQHTPQSAPQTRILDRGFCFVCGEQGWCTIELDRTQDRPQCKLVFDHGGGKKCRSDSVQFNP